jgi:hypothetical protein
MVIHGIIWCQSNNEHPISYGVPSSCDNNQKENRYALCEIICTVMDVENNVSVTTNLPDS